MTESLRRSTGAQQASSRQVAPTPKKEKASTGIGLRQSLNLTDDQKGKSRPEAGFQKEEVVQKLISTRTSTLERSDKKLKQYVADLKKLTELSAEERETLDNLSRLLNRKEVKVSHGDRKGIVEDLKKTFGTKGSSKVLKSLNSRIAKLSRKAGVRIDVGDVLKAIDKSFEGIKKDIAIVASMKGSASSQASEGSAQKKSPSVGDRMKSFFGVGGEPPKTQETSRDAYLSRAQQDRSAAATQRVLAEGRALAKQMKTCFKSDSTTVKDFARMAYNLLNRALKSGDVGQIQEAMTAIQKDSVMLPVREQMEKDLNDIPSTKDKVHVSRFAKALAEDRKPKLEKAYKAYLESGDIETLNHDISAYQADRQAIHDFKTNKDFFRGDQITLAGLKELNKNPKLRNLPGARLYFEALVKEGNEKPVQGRQELYVEAAKQLRVHQASRKGAMGAKGKSAGQDGQVKELALRSADRSLDAYKSQDLNNFRDYLKRDFIMKPGVDSKLAQRAQSVYEGLVEKLEQQGGVDSVDSDKMVYFIYRERFLFSLDTLKESSFSSLRGLGELMENLYDSRNTPMNIYNFIIGGPMYELPEIRSMDAANQWVYDVRRELVDLRGQGVGQQEAVDMAKYLGDYTKSILDNAEYSNKTKNLVRQVMSQVVEDIKNTPDKTSRFLGQVDRIIKAAMVYEREYAQFVGTLDTLSSYTDGRYTNDFLNKVDSLKMDMKDLRQKWEASDITGDEYDGLMAKAKGDLEESMLREKEALQGEFYHTLNTSVRILNSVKDLPISDKVKKEIVAPLSRAIGRYQDHEAPTLATVDEMRKRVVDASMTPFKDSYKKLSQDLEDAIKNGPEDLKRLAIKAKESYAKVGSGAEVDLDDLALAVRTLASFKNLQKERMDALREAGEQARQAEIQAATDLLEEVGAITSQENVNERAGEVFEISDADFGLFDDMLVDLGGKKLELSSDQNRLIRSLREEYSVNPNELTADIQRAIDADPPRVNREGLALLMKTLEDVRAAAFLCVDPSLKQAFNNTFDALARDPSFMQLAQLEKTLFSELGKLPSPISVEAETKEVRAIISKFNDTKGADILGELENMDVNEGPVIDATMGIDDALAGLDAFLAEEGSGFVQERTAIADDIDDIINAFGDISSPDIENEGESEFANLDLDELEATLLNNNKRESLPLPSESESA